MKIFYINLDKNTDKRQHMESLFPEAERFSGIYGAHETPETISYTADRTWRDPTLNRRLTNGEVGCILSHIKLWKKCVELNEPILILEDDVIALDSNWKEKIQKYFHSFDLLYQDFLTGHLLT